MNKIYKVVWSKAKHCYVVTSELAKRNGKGCGTRSLRMAAVSVGVTAALLGGFGTSLAEAAEVTVTDAGNPSSDIFHIQTSILSTYENIYVANNTLAQTGFSGNTMNVTGGTTTTYSFAGAGNTVSTLTEDISNNSINFSGGQVVNLFGAFSVSSGKTVSGNTANMTGGTVTKNVYGGYSAFGDVKGNKVEITGGEVTKEVYGGLSSSTSASNVDGNSVSISNDATVGNNVYGGKIDWDKSGTVTNNSVTLSGGTVGGLYGGYSRQAHGTGAVSGNTVEMKGGKLSGYGYIVGGYSTENYTTDNPTKVDVINNVVKITGDVDFKTSVVGGWAQGSGLVQNNRVEFSANNVDHDGEGEFSASVKGGHGGSGGATDNKVVFSKGTVNSVIGGLASKEVQRNSVEMSGGTVYGEITGGSGGSGTVDNNEVNISNGTVGKSASADSKTEVSGGYSSLGAVGFPSYPTMSASGIVSQNAVTISNGTYFGELGIRGGYMGASASAIAEDTTATVTGTIDSNAVTVSGGTYSGKVNIYGGYGNAIARGSGTATATATVAVTNNTATISGGTFSENVNVYGGYGGSSTEGNGTLSASVTVDNNKVIISDGKLKGNVYGGYNASGNVTGNAKGNKVEITGGTVQGVKAEIYDSQVYGGYSENGMAGSETEGEGNTVTVKGGTVYGEVCGGYAKTGNAKYNTTTMSDGNVEGGVIGGWAYGDATYNTLTVTGGTMRRPAGGYSYKGNANNNTVNFGGTATARNYLYGGQVYEGNANNNTVNITGGTIKDSVSGGYSNAKGVANGNTVNITGGTITFPVNGGRAYEGDANSNTLTISGTATIGNGNYAYMYGGWSDEKAATDNIVTVSGGTVNGAKGAEIYGGYSNGSSASTTGNTVNLTGTTTGLENAEVYGGSKETYTGNELHVGGTKDGSVTGVWTGSSNNKVKKVANFETVALHSVKWDTSVAALEATTLDGVNTLDITNLKFYTDAAGTSQKTSFAEGESMALLKTTESDLSTVKLTYDDTHKDIAITTAGVILGGGATDKTEETGVNGVKLTQSVSEKVVLAKDSKAINYSCEVGDVKGVTFGTMTWGTGRTADAGVSYAAVTNESIDTANLEFTNPETVAPNSAMQLLSGAADLTVGADITGHTQTFAHKLANEVSLNATLSGTVVRTTANEIGYTALGTAVNSVDLSGWQGSISAALPAGWTGAGVAVPGAFTEPEMAANSSRDILTAAPAGFFTDGAIDEAIRYKAGVNFADDEANGVTLAGTQSKGVMAADEGKKLVYAAGAKDVTDITLGTMTAGTPRAMNTDYDFANVATVNAGSFTFENPEEVTGDVALVTNAANLAADKDVTGKDHSQDFEKTASNQAVVTAAVKGTIATAAGAVNYTYGGTELKTVNLAKWNAEAADFDAAGWTRAEGATVETDGMNVSLDPGTVQTILTVTGVDLTGITVNGDTYKWKDGGESIAETSHESGVLISGGETTGGGVKVSDTNTSQLIYQQSKNTVAGITLGNVTFEKDGVLREFKNAYDLTNADIDATGFAVSNAATADMNAGDTMVVVDAANAIKGTGDATLKGFTAAPDPISVDFKDENVDGKALTFEGSHKDTLSLNDAKTQVIYKVGEKEVNKVAFTGEVAWNDSEVYYTNDAAKYKFNGATDIDTANLKVTGSSASELKKGDAMTLLSAEGMTAGTVTQPTAAAGIDMNFTEKGVAFGAKAAGEVKAEANAVKFEVTGVNVSTVDIGAVEWAKGETLADRSDDSYNYAGVTALGTGSFDMSFAEGVPETLAANDSMTLLQANATLTAIINEEKTKTYNFEPVTGVTVNTTLTGAVSRSGNNVVFGVTENKAGKLTFGNVEWKDSGALLSRPANITFAGADVDTGSINFTNIQSLEANRQMTLVSDFGDTVGSITGTKYKVGAALEGEGAASLSGSDLVFTTATAAESLIPTDATHETVMAMEAGTAVVDAGREFVDSAIEGLGLVSNMAPDGTATFASMGGGANRYKTGSHVDTHTWNAVVAVGRKQELKKGDLEWGVFAEYGRGNYTLHDDANGRGDGNTHYAGGGLLAKWTNRHDVYTEASIRMGRVSDSASNMLWNGAVGYGYDVHANYYGGHVGLGKIIKKGDKDLDVYGKFFYTKRNGVSFDAGGNHYELDSVDSSLLRVGARYGSNDRKWNWYGGLAYEYEFSGQSKGTVDGIAIRSASIKGGSVRGELGMRMEASKTNPWKADIGIYGYGGKHRGIGGNVSVAYMF